MTLALAPSQIALPAVTALIALLALGGAAWVVSIRVGKVGFVDSLWSIFFVLAAVIYLAIAGAGGTRTLLVFALLAAWALRLAVHIGLRNRGQPEDHRYQALREAHPRFAVTSLYLVFGLQATLAWFVSLPLLPALASPAAVTPLDAAAVLLWLTGMFFEVTADWQLARFRGDPSNHGQVLDTGLWRYTRHPNYFGEFCIWWAFYLFAVAAGGWWSLLSPIVMSILLLRVSGVALLEKSIAKRRPDYAGYAGRTNAFFPGWPRTPAKRRGAEN